MPPSPHSVLFYRTSILDIFVLMMKRVLIRDVLKTTNITRLRLRNQIALEIILLEGKGIEMNRTIPGF